jgi:hypothetical protein
MKKLSIVLIALLSSATVFAQSGGTERTTNSVTTDIVVSTDPDKVAEVERHAQMLKDKQEAAINAAEPTAAGPVHKGKRHHHKRHHKMGGMPQEDIPPVTQ